MIQVNKMTLRTKFDVLAYRREQHIQAVLDHGDGSCYTWCYLCRPYDHNHSVGCPVRGCEDCDRLLADAMLDSAMREEKKAC